MVDLAGLLNSRAPRRPDGSVTNKVSTRPGRVRRRSAATACIAVIAVPPARTDGEPEDGVSTVQSIPFLRVGGK